jgi:hypothetical protein
MKFGPKTPVLVNLVEDDVEDAPSVHLRHLTHQYDIFTAQ